MSYILEALRKSEKERKQDEIQTLGDISAPHHLAATRRKRSSSRPLQILFAFVLLLALILTGMMARDWNFMDIGQRSSVLPEKPVEKNNRKLQPDIKTPLQQSPPGTQKTSADTSGQNPARSSAQSSSVIKKSALTKPVPDKEDWLVFDRHDVNAVPPKDLPLTIQEDLRNMQFAGHAYSQDHSLRLIMINNKILHEGDPINADLRLSEITENGVILLYHKKRIRINLF
jgi:general secretion pathway protein B